MAMPVTPGVIGSVGLVTRRVRYGGRGSRCISIQRTRVRSHRQLLEQQAKELNERDPGTVAATSKQDGLMNFDNPMNDRSTRGQLTPEFCGPHIRDWRRGREVSPLSVMGTASLLGSLIVPCSLPVPFPVPIARIFGWETTRVAPCLAFKTSSSNLLSQRRGISLKITLFTGI